MGVPLVNPACYTGSIPVIGSDATRRCWMQDAERRWPGGKAGKAQTMAGPCTAAADRAVWSAHYHCDAESAGTAGTPTRVAHPGVTPSAAEAMMS